jgi:nucleotidyltransferase/DNA polymerase involved in DNA repair
MRPFEKGEVTGRGIGRLVEFRTGSWILPLYKESIMEAKDLKQVKYIGASRLKSLNDLGIDTIEQLYEMPVDKLAQIPTIGRHYAKLIKDAVSETCRAKPEGTALESTYDVNRKTGEIKEISIKQVEVLRKRLNRIFERLTPPEKKKQLELFDDLKKRSDTLINRLDGLGQLQGGLSKKISKKIIKKADALNVKLKNVGAKIKKKKVKKLACEIQSFSSMLKKTFT